MAGGGEAERKERAVIKIVLLDMTDNWEQDVSVADDVPLREVMVDLLRQLALPERDSNGEKVPYGMCVDGQDRMLEPDRALRESSVRSGARLRLLAAFTAYGAVG